MATVERKWIPVAEQAKLVRGALKHAFPGIKFSVRSATFSGGASIDVRYEDGPRQSDIQAVLNAYKGGDFDGMIDMAYNRSHYLRPDGATFVAYDPGTVGSMGTHEGEDNRALADVMPSDVIEVSFAANYVTANREISDFERKEAEALTWIRANCITEAEGTRFGNDWVDNIARLMVYRRIEGETWADAFENRHNR